MTLKTIAQSVARQVGFAAPSTIVNSSDEIAVQLLALAQTGGKYLARKGDWTALQTEHTFATVSGTASYALPSDFGHILNETVWNRDDFWRVRGPLSVQEWQEVKSGIIQTGPYQRFRIKGSAANRFFIDPTPDAAETVVFEYVSKNWCQSEGGTGQSAWAADTDTGILDEYLLELDLLWRFRRVKGLDYAEEHDHATRECSKALGRDGGAPTLRLSGRRFVLPSGTVPESGYGE